MKPVELVVSISAPGFAVSELSPRVAKIVLHPHKVALETVQLKLQRELVICVRFPSSPSLSLEILECHLESCEICVAFGDNRLLSGDGVEGERISASFSSIAC